MKKILKLFTSALLAASMLTPSLSVFAEESSDMKPLENLNALGGRWNFGDPITCTGSGDMFALSDSRAESFIFEADVEFVYQKGAASLVFLASDSPANGSYVANIDLTSGDARIFRFNESGNATTMGSYTLTDAEKAKSTFHLRVEVSGDSMLYFLDGNPVISVTDDLPKFGTRLGLLTFNTRLKYTNVRYAELSDDAPELTSLTGLSGTFSGQSMMTEKLFLDTTELDLTATVRNGTLSVTAKGATVKVSGNNITVTNIKDDFELIISVTKGDIVRNYALRVYICNEVWRAQLHFSPFTNWINDPNGLVYDPSNGTWHLFFQYNPYGRNWGNMTWGHAVSTDLMHWEELGVAIPQDSLGAVFSGSAVVDENNTTGFFTDNKPGESKLVAIYTSDGSDQTHGAQKQCIAYSKDHGVTWVKPDLKIDKNIVISNAGNQYGSGFRDPKIFRYDDKWFMVVAGGRARLFTSDNLIDWTLVCDMGLDSECPDFYPLAVDGDQNNIKWVYTAAGDWYIIGRLEKVSDTEYSFVAESERIPYNGGGEVYATQSFYNDGSGLNRRIGISWLQDYSADPLIGKDWNGAMSLPLQQTLRTVNGEIILTSYPVAELDALRGRQVIDLQNPTVEKADEALSQNPGKAYDLELTFRPAAGSVTTLTLRQGGSDNVQVIYDSTAKKLRVVRDSASTVTDRIPTGTMEMPLSPDPDGNVTIRVVMDTTIIEVFGNGGEAACTGYIFPNSNCINSSLTVSGEIEIGSLKLWRMTSIWHKGEDILPEPGIYLDAPALVLLNEETAVSAYFLNENGEREDASVVWSGVDTELATVVSNDGGKLVLKGVAKGRLTLTATAGNYSRELTLSVSDTWFDTNLEGWTSAGDWYVSEKGWTIANNNNGDSFTFSTVAHNGDFTYTGVADFGGQGGCLGLVFGVTDPDSSKSFTWYGANVDTHSSTVSIKLFCNTDGSEAWQEILTIPAADTYTLTVTYEGDTLTYTVNGQSVSHQVPDLAGTLGLVSWNGGGSFNHVNYTSGTEAVPPVTNDPTAEPGDPADTDNGSPLLPILIGVGAVAVIGAVAAVVAVKKKKK